VWSSNSRRLVAGKNVCASGTGRQLLLGTGLSKESERVRIAAVRGREFETCVGYPVGSFLLRPILNWFDSWAGVTRRYPGLGAGSCLLTGCRKETSKLGATPWEPFCRRVTRRRPIWETSGFHHQLGSLEGRQLQIYSTSLPGGGMNAQKDRREPDDGC